EGLRNLPCGNDDGLRQLIDYIRTLDLDCATVGLLTMCRSQRNLDLFSAPLADQEVVVLLDVFHDRLVHLIARDPHRIAVHDAGEPNPRPLGRAATDIDDHAAPRFLNRHARSDRRSHRSLDEVYLAGAGLPG